LTALEGPPLSSATGVGALTIGGFLVDVSSRFGDHEALVFDDPLQDGATVRWSYSELLRQSHRVAAALVACGVSKGARVGILMGNRPEAVASFFGAGLAGAVVVPLSTFSPPPEIGYMLAHADVDVLLTQVEMLGRRYADDVRSLPATDFPYLRRMVAVGTPDWPAFLSEGAEVGTPLVEARAAHVRPSDEGLIIYSSGTTSRPKGVLHRHRSPALQFWLQADVFGRHQKTRMWMSLPMFWTAGLNTGMGATLAAGGCWVMQEYFEPGEALRLMARERVTEPYTLPHQTGALEEHPDWAGTDLSSLKSVYGKSAFARHPSVQGDTNWNMPVAYGLSETCTGFATHYSNTPRELLKESSGRLLPGNRLRVVDPDTGCDLPAGEVGELCLAGPTLMERYVGLFPEECLDDLGFFHTGDVGYFDDEGFLHWTGRRSEMIKTGGASVSPAEIEVALRACPPVKLARVVGLPDERLEQVVILCVVLKDGAAAAGDDIKVFLRQRLSSYKVPKHVLFFADGEIPMTGSDAKVRDADLLKLVAEKMATEVDS
jgi:acyl-CoA synthetase (AMP-forming)/AMP-acid ligase II